MPEAAIAHGRGAGRRTGRTILDVGGESTRPGAEEVERRGGAAADRAGRRRRSPALGHTVSIDTSKLAVAEAALDAGASIVNDVTALRGDPEIGGALRRARGGRGADAHAGEPADDAGRSALRRRRRRRQGASSPSGSRRRSPPASPRSGSGSTRGSASARRSSTTWSCCGGSASCASSAGRWWSAPRARASSARSTAPTSDERIGGTIASSVLAAAEGADVLRVHDVAEVAQAIRVAAAILG